MESVGCITKKFERLLNETGAPLPFMYSDPAGRLGRHLQSIDGTDGNIGIRVGSQADAIKKFGDIHKEIFRDLSAGLIYLKDSFGEDFDILDHVGLLKTLGKVDFAQLKKLFGDRMVHELMDYRHTLKARARQFLRSKTHKTEGNLYNDECDMFLGKEVCDILRCLSSFDETEYEDNVEFVKCLFECE